MSVITRIGKVWPIGHATNCQVATGGPECVRHEHEAYCLPYVRARRDREYAAQVRKLGPSA
jgi:hypothetical protein